MFDVLPNLLSSIITILFPIFASYKALRTSDPAQLTPWLMYWVVFSVFSLIESWTWFILSWLPFYAYIRLFLLSYLVLPQTQGARLLYQQQIHPFLAHHEHEIDQFIISAHDRARAAGLNYFKRAIEFVKENALGIQPTPRATEAASQGGTYAQNLLARFNLPSARQGLAAPSGDFYGLLSAAAGSLNTSGGASREAQVEDLNTFGTLIPDTMTSTSEKITFLSTQRERLGTLLSALDKEADHLGTEATIERDVDRRLAGDQLGEGLRKSKSEAEFEEIGKEDLNGSWDGKKAGGGGGYSLWGWGAKAAAAVGGGGDGGRSSGTDAKS